MNHTRRRGLALDKSRLSIDGRALSDYAVFVTADGISLGEAKPATAFTPAPGRDGGYDTTLDDRHGYPAVGRRTITVRVAATGDPLQIEEAKALIGATAGRHVAFGGLTGLGAFRGRLTAGAWTDATGPDGRTAWSVCELTLDAEPFAYGHAERIELKPGGAPTPMLVKGNRPAPPLFHQLVEEHVDDVPAHTVTHTFAETNGPRIRVENTLTGTGLWDPAHELTIDCERHETTWRGTRIPIRIDDDFFTLKPGKTSLTGLLAPTGHVASYTQYVTYEPRWLI